MFKIVKREELNPTVTRIEVVAPHVANKAKPGQFIILRVDQDGERLPFTVAGVNKSEGTVEFTDSSNSEYKRERFLRQLGQS